MNHIDATRLGKRAARCSGFRVQAGMLLVDDRGHTNRCTKAVALRGRFPDVTDPATVGCLMAQAREAIGNPYLRTRFSGHRQEWQARCAPFDAYQAYDPHESALGAGETEAEALINAWEAVTRGGVAA